MILPPPQQEVKSNLDEHCDSFDQYSVVEMTLVSILSKALKWLKSLSLNYFLGVGRRVVNSGLLNVYLFILAALGLCYGTDLVP